MFLQMEGSRSFLNGLHFKNKRFLKEDNCPSFIPLLIFTTTMKLVKGPSIYYVNWVGGSRKWPVLLTFSTVSIFYMLTLCSGWVGGSEKVQNYGDVIYGWSLIYYHYFQ